MVAFTTGATLTHANAMAELEAGLAAIAVNTAEVVRVDCAALAQFDSSALAVLLAWLRAARARGKAFEVANLPAKLKNLARAYGINELLER